MENDENHNFRDFYWGILNADFSFSFGETAQSQNLTLV